MYPDETYHYHPEEDEIYKCPDLQDHKFIKCVNDANKKGDPDGSKYKDCLRQTTNRCLAENGTEFIIRRHITKTKPIKCDKLNKVYRLTRDESNFEKKLYHECNRPFVVHKIPNSNLILLKTNHRYCNKDSEFDDYINFHHYPVTPTYGEYGNMSLFCFKRSKPELFRNRPNPKLCFSSHINVRF